MKIHEKLQELRKQKGLTQEELAEILYVSRTAISKWESGRGYPNIDSLKAISRFFGVTVDELLSGDEVLTIAEEDNKQKDTSCLIRVSVFVFAFKIRYTYYFSIQNTIHEFCADMKKY